MIGNAAVWCAVLLGGAVAGLVAYEALVRLFAEAPGRGRTADWPEGASPATGGQAQAEPRWRARVRDALGSVTRLLERFAPLARADSDACRECLRRAGVSIAPETWRSVRVVSAAACAALGALLASAAAFPLPEPVALTVGAGVAGWALPAADLARRERKRREAIEAWLPDAMELLGIAIAAGSPIEQCFREVASSMDGPLSEELDLVDQEVNLLGLTREQALGNLAERCRSQEVGAFAAQLAQAISQGSSIASGLAAQAALARETAQADALERIRKMPTKLDIVLSLCFLPPTVVLVIVPTVVNLLAFLNDSMT